MTYVRNWIITSLCLLVLAGCGGGASDSSGTLTLAVTAPPANSDQKGTATATYAPVGGKSPQGVKIDFSANSPLVVFDSYQGSVGTDGKATVSFRVLPSPTATQATITASTGDLVQSQQLSIAATSGAAPVTPPEVGATPNSLTFVSASPTRINLKGFGTTTNPETSIVTFVVKDTAGNALSGQTVDFTLDTAVGGIALTPTSAVTNASGQAVTIVSSGTIVTPVRITATVHGTSITAQSTQLVIAGGPPDQDSLSVSLSTFNPEALTIDGTEVTVTARLADHYNNPVADGTAVYFTTSGGSIKDSCTTTGGVCSVKWTSQNPRPVITGSNVNAGTADILAFAVGEETFTDANNNGIADGGACSSVSIDGVGIERLCGEFYSIPDAFRDDNLNGVYDASTNEPFYNLTGTTTYTNADDYYQGSFVSSGTRSKYIFSNSTLIMSGSSPKSTDGVTLTEIVVPFNTTTSSILAVVDRNDNPMPAGTTISASVVPGSTTACITVTPASIAVPNTTNVDYGTNFNISLTNKCAASAGGPDSITFTVRTPSGQSTPVTIPLAYSE